MTPIREAELLEISVSSQKGMGGLCLVRICIGHTESVSIGKVNAAYEVHSVRDHTNFSWLPVLAGHHRLSCQCHLLLTVVQSYQTDIQHVAATILHAVSRFGLVPDRYSPSEKKKCHCFTCHHMVHAQTQPNP